MPVASIVYVVTYPPPEDTLMIPVEIWAIAFSVFGGIVGLLGVLASRILSPGSGSS